MAGKILTVSQARNLDSKAREKFGIPAILLMENAGRAVSEEVSRVIGGGEMKVAIFCGKGNNGGDGFCAARHLISRGVNPDIYLCGSINEVRGEAKVNLEILLKLKKGVFQVNPKKLKAVRARIPGYGLIVDALFGVGIKGLVKGIFADIINTINQSRAYIISVDIPSGLDANTGRVLGVSVKADATVTFIAKKKGMVKGEGERLCGRIVVENIGFPL
ncbi:MAG: NAD(P)H-hydrate epimerase [Candidatus Omnitrophota bacterium]|jgi:NAD(P)H-hydrate epimerase